jgi:hypothetical protein
MATPRIYHDFHLTDASGRLKLTLLGTLHDLVAQGIDLREGQTLMFWCDDATDEGEDDALLVEGVVYYNPDEQCWVAAIDWNAFRHASEEEGVESKQSG